jgi:hypothetical protein
MSNTMYSSIDLGIVTFIQSLMITRFQHSHIIQHNTSQYSVKLKQFHCKIANHIEAITPMEFSVSE